MRNTLTILMALLVATCIGACTAKAPGTGAEADLDADSGTDGDTDGDAGTDAGTDAPTDSDTDSGRDTPVANCDPGTNLGGPQWEPDPDLYDANYPDIEVFGTAGVRGGIPHRSAIAVVETIGPGDDIQAAIDSASDAGGGAVLLQNGLYNTNYTIELRSNVVLRGQSRTGTIIQSTLRQTWEGWSSKKEIVDLPNISYAGLEDLTLHFIAPEVEPVDREGYDDGGWYGEAWENDPGGITDLYVRGVNFNDSTNCWLDNIQILESGTDPILLSGTHNTVRGCFIDRCYNKGGGGNGYFDIRGDNNLVVHNRVLRIRHVAIQNGAQYNVVFKNHFEVDVNYHNADDGHNLVEQNEILIPTWRGWGVFSTGGASYGHEPPGPNNIIVNNTTDLKTQGPVFAEPDTIYTYTDYGDPDQTDWPMPMGGTFYPMKCDTGD
jgi:hypothetical protein